MSELAIFIYGFVVFSIVSTACWLIVYGIINERRDRQTLDAGPDARPLESPATTSPSGERTGGGRRESR
jgi:hypothetical protein